MTGLYVNIPSLKIYLQPPLMFVGFKILMTMMLMIIIKMIIAAIIFLGIFVEFFKNWRIKKKYSDIKKSHLLEQTYVHHCEKQFIYVCKRDTHSSIHKGHKRKTICMRSVSEGFLAEGYFEDTLKNTLWRETIPLQSMY